METSETNWVWRKLSRWIATILSYWWQKPILCKNQQMMERQIVIPVCSTRMSGSSCSMIPGCSSTSETIIRASFLMKPGWVFVCTSPVFLNNFTVLHNVVLSTPRVAAISLLFRPNNSLCQIILHLRSTEYAEALLGLYEQAIWYPLCVEYATKLKSMCTPHKYVHEHFWSAKICKINAKRSIDSWRRRILCGYCKRSRPVQWKQIFFTTTHRLCRAIVLSTPLTQLSMPLRG